MKTAQPEDGDQGAVMKMGRWIGLLAAATLLAGCGDFWQAPSSSSFTLSNSGNITVSSGAAGSGNSTITVTPGSSFTGTVTLSCAVTAPTGATSPTTCGLSSTSLTFSSTTAQTSTLTATTTSSTTAGAYQILVTGVSGSVTETTTVCVVVGSGTCSSTASTSGNFYILNSSTSSSSSIAGFYISSKTLNAISGSSVTVNGIAYAVAIAPNGKFLCVSSSDGVYAYPITSGALGTGVQVTSDLAYALQIDSTDSWLLEAIPVTGGVTLNAVPISSSNGTYTGSTVNTASFTVTSASLAQGQMVISPDNNYIFVALETGGTIVVPFSSSSPFPSGTTGKTIAVANTGGSALSVAVDPSSRLFYIGETLAGSGGTTGGLRAFTYSSLSGSSLTQATGSPIAGGGLKPTFILPVASPSYVYVANGVGNITGFAVSGSSSSGYTLTTGSSVSAGYLPAGMALDSTSSYVFEVGSNGSPYFDAYTFDSTTAGQLDSQVTSTSAATSIAIVATP